MRAKPAPINMAENPAGSALRTFLIAGHTLTAPKAVPGLHLVATPHRQSRRYHPARAGNAGRRRHHRLRGHPHHPPADRALCDIGAAEALSRAQCRAGAAENPGKARARRLDRFGVGRRHAADLRSRLQAGARGLRGRSSRDRVAGAFLGAGGARGGGIAHRPVLLRRLFALQGDRAPRPAHPNWRGSTRRW